MFFSHPFIFTDTSQAAEKSLDELKNLKTPTEAQIGSGRAALLPSPRTTPGSLLVLMLTRYSPRTRPVPQLCQPLHHRLRHQKCKVHRHRHRLLAAPHRRPRPPAHQAEPGPRGSPARHLGRPGCPAQDPPGTPLPALQLCRRRQGRAAGYRPEHLFHPAVEQECHCQQHLRRYPPAARRLRV